MRQFDESLQKLSKLFYAFTVENGITTTDETLALLQSLGNKITAESQLAYALEESEKSRDRFIAGKNKASQYD